ncbi:MAG: hypothetical protein OEW33_14665 [Nitrospirota bacterium]|nr:hypothetical protein [Nitrospirota bacterium]MDH4361962.1 hypothetical protein [Nitrospirota bacterium]
MAQAEDERAAGVIGNLPALVIPDLCHRESILISFRIDSRYLPVGMTEMGYHSRLVLAGIS